MLRLVRTVVAGNAPVIHNVGPHYWIQFVVEDSIGLVFSLFTWYLCIKSLRYEEATAQILREYGSKIEQGREHAFPLTVSDEAEVPIVAVAAN